MIVIVKESLIQEFNIGMCSWGMTVQSIQYWSVEFRNDWSKHSLLECTVYEWLVEAFSIVYTYKEWLQTSIMNACIHYWSLQFMNDWSKY